MSKKQSNSLLFSLAFFFLLILGCDKKEVKPTDELIYVGSWTIGWPQLGHDGKPYEGTRVVVYGNYSDQETRIKVAGYAETALDDILDIYGVSWEDDYNFLYPKKKIDIFCDDSQLNSSGLAYRDGIIMRTPFSARFNQVGTTIEQWKRTLQHELSHVNEFLLIGNSAFQQANDVWLREGMANYGARNHRIQTLAELLEWKEKMKDVPGGGNPISIHIWSDFPQTIISANRTIEYYGFFELAARYLIDPKGNGSTIQDIVNFYKDLGAGDGYHSAFVKNFKLNPEYLEENYWAIMEHYLKD